MRIAPRILGLGSPKRNLTSDADDEDDDDEDQPEPPIAEGNNYGTGTLSNMHLSPIKEVDSQEIDEVPQVPRMQLAPPGFTGPHGLTASDRAALSPRQLGYGNQETPCKNDLSDSGPALVEPPPSEAGKATKLIYVNGVAYTQVQTIGRGGSSKVYLVQNPAGEVFALKRVVTDSSKQLEAFQNEVTLLQQLKNCEQVIQVLDAEVDKEKGRIHIVMEAGEMDLGRYLQTESRLGLAQIQNLWRQMLQAVQVIHHERIVHSDLKPGNFLLVNGRLKVIDFGIAKRISNDTTNISRDTSMGTLSYMAPEAVKQGQLKLGRASDIWSLGIILYQMLYGSPPFAHLEPMQRLLVLSDPTLTIKFPAGHRLEHHSPTTKAQLVQILQGCLQRDPRKRPSLKELLGHPFLRTSMEVHRESVNCVVNGLMSSVCNMVASALQVDMQSLEQQQEWQMLADEVWQHLLSQSTQRRDDAHITVRSTDTTNPQTEMSGLGPLKEHLHACLENAYLAPSKHKGLATRGSTGSDEGNKENDPMRAPLVEIKHITGVKKDR